MSLHGEHDQIMHHLCPESQERRYFLVLAQIRPARRYEEHRKHPIDLGTFEGSFMEQPSNGSQSAWRWQSTRHRCKLVSFQICGSCALS